MSYFIFFVRALTLLFLLFFFQACGGGGSNDANRPAQQENENPEVSSNADLEYLEVLWDGNTTELRADNDTAFFSKVADNTTRVTLNIGTVNAESEIIIDGIERPQGVTRFEFSLELESILIDITVISQDKRNQKKYTVDVFRETSSNNASLFDLGVVGASLRPPFSPDVLFYSADIFYSKSDVLVFAKPSDLNSSLRIKINGQNEDVFYNQKNVDVINGENRIEIQVSSPDKRIIKNYVITLSPGGLDVLKNQDSLTSIQPILGDRFGFSASINKDVIAVGAIGADSIETVDAVETLLEDTGAVHIYENNENTWAHRHVLAAHNKDAEDLFGWSVALSEDILVVGAPGEDSSPLNDVNSGGLGVNDESTDSGAAYVYRKHEGLWIFDAFLKASNADSFDLFGNSVAVHNGFIAVSAINEDSDASNPLNNTVESSGAVYIFTKIDGQWMETSMLKASNPSLGDHFGSSLAVLENTLVIGAPEEDSSSTEINGRQDDLSRNSGAVYVFSYDGERWREEAFIKSPNNLHDNKFGASVALSSSVLVVGSPNENSSSTGINGDSSNFGAEESGAAYVFNKENGQWGFSTFIKASNTYPFSNFGSSVSADKDLIVVGSIGESSHSLAINGDQLDRSEVASGAAYVFHYDGFYWKQIHYVKSQNTQRYDNFSWSMSLSDENILIGSPFEDNRFVGDDDRMVDDLDGEDIGAEIDQAGAAYIYQFGD